VNNTTMVSEPNPAIVIAVMCLAAVFGLWLATWLFCYRDEDDERALKELKRMNEYHAEYFERLNKREEIR